MNYYELKQLKELLKRYIEQITEYDCRDILFKINEDVLDSLAIIVNKHLSDGKSIENIIRRKLEVRIYEMIDNIANYNLKNGMYIKPNKIKLAIKKSLNCNI